jgi:hypothetical protein
MLRGEAWIEEEWGPGIFVIRMVKVLCDMVVRRIH